MKDQGKIKETSNKDKIEDDKISEEEKVDSNTDVSSNVDTKKY